MQKDIKHIVIVGGGVSGICAATKLATDYMQHHPASSSQRLEITIIDPSEKLGGPLYNTPSINAFLAQPLHEIDMPQPHKRRDYASKTAQGKLEQMTYSDYGKYLRDHLENLWRHLREERAPVRIRTEKRDGGSNPFVQAEVLDAWEEGKHAKLKLSNGTTIEADAVVLATGNPLPEDLRDSHGKKLERWAGYYRCYQEGLAPEKLNETDQMVLLGMGASAHTFAAAAIRNGYKGSILLASRRGKSPECEPPPHDKPPRHYTFHHFTLANLQQMKTKKGDVTADEFWELFLKETRRAAPLGFSQREIADACFEDFNDMNRVMSVEERTKFAEKYGANWNFMTNRVPEVHREILGKLCTDGRIDYREKIVSIDHLKDGGFEIRFNDGKEPPTITTPKIVNCTGPSVRIADMSPLLHQMEKRGLVVQHKLAGINVDTGLRVQDKHGESSKIFYALGPLTQGEFFESVSVPAIKLCADTLIDSITKDHGLGQGEGVAGSGRIGPKSGHKPGGSHR